ncbi:MAG: RHS domain-containing protein, partial [Burkholderiaceae bacterium]|nr:RHS domain-containing protein [Burkholderiaceae bacterium]
SAMSLLAAARLGDDISHTSLLGMICKVGAGLIVGAVVGAVVGVVAAAAVAAVGLTGGAALVAGALLSSLLMKVTGAGDLIGAVTNKINNLVDEMIPPVVKGKISQGSFNVYVNKKSAARAVEEGNDNLIACQDHPAPQYIAEGSNSVFINNSPAHRKTERTTCDGKTSSASSNVFYGGETVQVREITSEMPWWLEHASTIIGIAIALCTRDGSSLTKKLTCLGVSMLVSAGADAVVNAAFGNPVHAGSGAKFLDGEDDFDFSLPARLPLVWVRRYNSQDTRPHGPLGQGWSLPITVELHLNRQIGGLQPHTLYTDEGLEMDFENMFPGQRYDKKDSGWSLAHTQGGHWLAEGPDGLLYDFGPSQSNTNPQTLKLLRIEDRNGNYLALRYDEQNRLFQIADSAGRLYECEYQSPSPERISAVLWKNAPGTTQTLVSYEYDAQGRLSQVINTLGEISRHFTWHDSGVGKNLMQSHRLPTGLQSNYEWVQLENDPHPRVIRNFNNMGQSWQAHYTLPLGEQPPSNPALGKTEVVDHLGRKQTWYWNERYQICSWEDAQGHTWKMQWNAEGLLSHCEQPNGGVWKFEYDSNANLCKQINPLGHIEQTLWRQDLPLPLKETDAQGHITEYEYDHKGNLQTEITPAGSTCYVLDQYGQVTRIKDAQGLEKQLMWRNDGQLALYIDCSNRITRFEYDAFGNLSQQTDALGHANRYEYNALGQLIAHHSPDGASQRWAWQAGKLKAWQNPKKHITSWQYTAAGQLALQQQSLQADIMPDGQASTISTHYQWDSAGNLSQLLDPNKAITHFKYDAADRLIAQIGSDDLRTEYTLDSLGKPVKVVQAAGTPQAITLHLQRDALGQLICKTTPETISQYTYSPIGQLVSIKRYARAMAETETADLAQESRLLDEIHFVYNPAGDLIEENQIIHALLKTAQYPHSPDLPNSELYRAPLAKPRINPLKHQYDALGNRTQTTLPGGHTVNSLYYGSGHLHQININGHIITDIERDLTHREIERTQGKLRSEFTRDALGRIQRSWSYRQGQRQAFQGTMSQHGFTGQRVEPLDPGWHRLGHPEQGDVILKGFIYDPAGELIKRRDPLLGEQSYQYDALGRITHSQNLASAKPLPKGADPTVDPQWFKMTMGDTLPKHPQWDERFSWDAASNPIASALPSVPDPQAPQSCVGNRITVWQDIRYEYDTLGRLRSKRKGKADSQKDSTLQLSWNAENQLIRSQQKSLNLSQTCEYFYDALGRRIGKEDGFGITWFNWEGMRLLQEERGSQLKTYFYAENAYTPLAYWNSSIDPKTPLNPADIYYYHCNINGAPEELSNHEGKVVWQARYRTWGNTVLEEWFAETTGLKTTVSDNSAPQQQNLRFQGQYFDAESGLHYNTFRYYDPDCGRFISQDPIGLLGGLNLYQYAPNPLSWVDPWGWAACNNAPNKVTPNTKQTANLNRFSKKIPVNAKNNIELKSLPNGSIAAQATSPGKVPGSKAVYEKQIDANGNTVQYTKTTYDPDGKIVHVKDKLDGSAYSP